MLGLRRATTDLRIITSRPRPIPFTPVSLHHDTRRRFGQRVMATTEPVKRFTPQEVIAKLDSQFDKARESKDLLFFPSTIHRYTDIGVDVRFFLFSPLPQLETVVFGVLRLAECSGLKDRFPIGVV